MRINVFRDRDGDLLSVMPRREENTVPDTVISITHKSGKTDITQNIVFTEDEGVEIVIKLVRGLKFNKAQLMDIRVGIHNILANMD